MNKDIASIALEIAIKNGANQVRVTQSDGIESNISVLDNELERLQSATSSSLLIQIVVNDRFGSFSTNRMEEEDLTIFIKKAIESVKLLSPDSCRSLPQKERYYKGDQIDLQQFDEKFDSIAPHKKKELIFSVAEQIDFNDKRIISASSEYSDSRLFQKIIDSNGFEGESKMTIYSLSTECSVKDNSDARPQNYWYDASIDFDSLKKDCGKIAMERTLKMIGAKKGKSGKYSVVIDNSVSSRLVSPLLSALNGASIQQRNSFLLDSLGKKVFSEKFNLIDKPLIVGAMGSRLFDCEGVATKEMDIIKDGIVNYYYLNTYYSNKLGISPTIDSPSAPTLMPFGADNLSSILKDVNSGIYLTGFNGGNANNATGDFSYGIEGFVFENGEIKYPIKEMNMTGNIISLWDRIIHIGNDSRRCSMWNIPTIAFDNIDFSGI